MDRVCSMGMDRFSFEIMGRVNGWIIITNRLQGLPVKKKMVRGAHPTQRGSPRQLFMAATGRPIFASAS
jgi:hypothetical protein